MTIFTVYEKYSRRVLLETDDWVDAEVRSAPQRWRSKDEPVSIRGTHPTHDWDDQHPRRCRKCDGWDNGSYGSHAPCGYDFGGMSLVGALERELAARSGTDQ